MAARNYRRGTLPFEFVIVPRRVLASDEWLRLPDGARSLMLDLMQQYSGGNNGRLTPAYEVMKRYGWISKSKLHRAKLALLETSFTILTRRGHPPRTSEWIAFNWWSLNHHPTMDIDPRSFPHRGFVIEVFIGVFGIFLFFYDLIFFTGFFSFFFVFRIPFFIFFRKYHNGDIDCFTIP